MDNSNIQTSLREAREKIESGDCRMAYKLLTPLIAKENPEALYLYSMFSIAGTETDEEFDRRRIRLLQLASASGYAPATFELGLLHQIGDLVEKDTARAALFFKEAAESGYSKAKLEYGLDLYYGSNGVQKNEAMGLNFIRQAKGENIDGADEALRQIESNESASE